MDRLLLATYRLRVVPHLQAEIARGLGITRGAVAKWKRVPAERVLAVERISGIARHLLRPDIYPPPPSDNGVEERLASLPPRRKLKNPSNAVA